MALPYQPIAPALVLWIASAELASAKCTILEYDRTPPHAEIGSVHNQFAEFEWASDVDEVQSGSRSSFMIWNWVLNRGSRGLQIKWDKGNIELMGVASLAPNSAFCSRFSVSPPPQQPDYNAPISYGLSLQKQNAAAFVAAAEKPAATQSQISFTYLDYNGQPQDLGVGLYSYLKVDGVFVQMEHTPNIIIGISGIANAVPAEAINRMMASAKNYDAAVEQDSFGNFAASNAAEYVKQAYPEKSEADARMKQIFTFIRGGAFGKFSFELTGSEIRQHVVDMVLLDRDRRPVAFTKANMLLPSK